VPRAASSLPIISIASRSTARFDSIGEAERRLTAAMTANGGVGRAAVEAWVAPRKAEVERISMAINEIANSGLTLSKLSVAASLLGDLAKAEAARELSAGNGACP